MSDKLQITSFWQQLYVEMLANPNEDMSDVEFCNEAKVPISTFRLWKRNNRVQIYNEVQRSRNMYINELRATAWKELALKMKKDTNAIKLAFQLTGDLVEKTETKHEYMNRQDKSDRINNLIKEINEKKETWRKVKEAQSGVAGSEGNTPISDVPLGNEPGKDLPSDGTV